MSGAANPMRGEARLSIGGETVLLRPTFAALVAAEEALGPLLALVERAAEGRLTPSEIARLVWHCIAEPRPELTVEKVGEALTEMGLTKAAPILKTLLGQILHGETRFRLSRLLRGRRKPALRAAVHRAGAGREGAVPQRGPAAARRPRPRRGGRRARFRAAGRSGGGPVLDRQPRRDRRQGRPGRSARHL
jgi:hypothetical protein